VYPSARLRFDTPGYRCLNTGKVQNSKLVYPRSLQFRQCLPERRDYEALASAADISVRDYSEEKIGTKDGSSAALALEESKRRRICKSFVETDRRLRAEEAGFRTRMMLMNPKQCTPKNDMLVGWPKEWGSLEEEEKGENDEKGWEEWLWEDQ
jgi:hypothetical protein